MSVGMSESSMVGRVASGGDPGEYGFEEGAAVGRAEQLVHRPLRMWPHAENVPGGVNDLRDGAPGAVGAPVLVGIAGPMHVSEYHAPLALEAGERLLVGRAAAIAVRDGNG